MYSEITIKLNTNNSTSCHNEYRPVIGVIANPYPDDDDSSYKSYIYYTHIASIEENGGRVLPILPWWSDEQLHDVLSKINGVLMQGGSRNLNLDNHFEKFNTKIIDWVINHNLNNKDNPFPLVATCQGIELLYAILYNNVNVLNHFNSWNYFIPMNLIYDSIKNSKTFKLFKEEDFETLENKPCTVHLHNYGIDLDIDKKMELSDKYKDIVNLKILTYASDRDGKKFIGNVEDERLNILATIFHPEQMPYNYCLSVYEELFTSESFSVNKKIEEAYIVISRESKNRMCDSDIDKYNLISNSSRLNYTSEKMSDEDYFYDFLIFEKEYDI